MSHLYLDHPPRMHVTGNHRVRYTVCALESLSRAHTVYLTLCWQLTSAFMQVLLLA